MRAYVRPDILQGNAPIHHRQFLPQTLKLAKNALRKLVPMRLA
jgi:hypothetical protein